MQGINNHMDENDYQEVARASAVEGLPEPTEHQQFAESLRQLATWYEAHPEVPLPQLELSNYSMDTKDDAAILAKALRTFEKRYADTLLIVSKKFGLIELKFFLNRDSICTSRVVGVETIPAQFIEARTIPARTREILEWDCHALNVDEEKSNG